MTTEETKALAVYAKELFPMTTDAQAAALRDVLAPFPDPNFASERLKQLATETQRLPIPLVKELLNNELRRRNLTVQDQERRKERGLDRKTADYWTAVDAMLAEFSDDELEALKGDALLEMKPDTAAFLKKRDPRKCRPIMVAIYARLTGRAA